MDNKKKKRSTGQLGEQAVIEYLLKKGYTIVDHNYHAKCGGREEIDIIACDGDVLAFVEVKTRKKNSWLSAMDALTPQKRRRIFAGAQNFLMTQEGYERFQPRFDVACVTTEDGMVTSVDYYENAFSLCDIEY